MIGEMGNATGAYTSPLPSLAAALDAIRAARFDRGPSFRPSRPTWAICEGTVAHPPQVRDPVGGCYYGGLHTTVDRRWYDLRTGAVHTHDSSRPTPGPVPVPDAEIPAEWLAYRASLATSGPLR